MMAWLHDRGELGLGEVFTHRKVDKELACFQLIVNSIEKAIKVVFNNSLSQECPGHRVQGRVGGHSHDHRGRDKSFTICTNFKNS